MCVAWSIVLIGLAGYGALASEAGGECSMENECPQQMICANGHCMPATPTRNICSPNRSCPAGEKCRHQICWSTLYQQCTRTAQCMPNLICRYGFCDVETRGYSCTDQVDCPGAEVCVRSRCTQATPTQTVCHDDFQCNSEGQRCKFGFCWQYSSSAVTTSDPDFPTGCLDHSECSQTSICLYRKCQEATPSRQRCKDDRDCPADSGCKYHFCWTPDEEVVKDVYPEVESKLCKSHDDCGLTKVCSRLEGTCVPAYPIGKVCQSNSHCAKEEYCREQVCWRKGQENGQEEGEPCSETANCNGYTICMSGQCAAAVPMMMDCVNDVDCPQEDSACKYGQCWLSFNEQEAEYEMYKTFQRHRHFERRPTYEFI